MSPLLEFAARTVLVGAGATALLDLWSAFLQRSFGVPSPNWGLVGRWVGAGERFRNA